MINQREKRSGVLWQAEYYERAVRDEKDFCEKHNYIVYNPVKTGLAKNPKGYPYSSESHKEMVDCW